MVWTPPGTWVPGENAGVAAKLNSNLRDNLLMLSDSWQSFTSAWSGSTTNPVLGNGVQDSAYMQIGKWIRFRILITMGSTTTYGSGSYFLTLPAAPTTMRWLFTGIARHSTTSYPLGLEYDGTLPMRLRNLGVSPLTNTTPTTPFAWAVGDTMFISGQYEAA